MKIRFLLLLVLLSSALTVHGQDETKRRNCVSWFMERRERLAPLSSKRRCSEGTSLQQYPAIHRASKSSTKTCSVVAGRFAGSAEH